MGQRPVVMVFARSADEKLAKFCKELDEEIEEHADTKLTAFLDADAAADMLAWEHVGSSVDASVRITKVRSVLPRHKAANWVGPGRGRKSTRPGTSGVVELSPFEFLDRLARTRPGA
ncbi:MAG: hypothetical protein WCQ77_01215 [Planctomycetota bacterium]